MYNISEFKYVKHPDKGQTLSDQGAQRKGSLKENQRKKDSLTAEDD